RLWSRVPERFEWLLIADPRHVYYLSNFWVNPLSFSAGERGLLLLERGAGATLVADNFTRRSAAGQPFVEQEVIQSWYDHKHSVINRDHALLDALRSLSDRLYGRIGAVEAEWMPLAAWEVMAFDHEVHTLRARGPGQSRGDDPLDSVDLGSLLRELRRQKLPDEIELLNECMKAGAAGLERARSVIRPGVSDWDVYQEMHAAVLESTGRPAMIYGDFRATNASTPKAGGAPIGQKLQQGDLLILDYSVVLDGYRSDFTNTLAVGEPAEQQEILFALCTTAMRQGETVLRAGSAARDVHAATMKVFHDAGYGEFFPHHAGHGLGLGHPEPPILVPDSEDTLLAGDVVTLEPGLYVPGVGGVRIEHNYQITETSYVRLSQHEIAL
ncbi:MAG: peptidase, partial [Planctomycetaceae bacterium]|nr:peptidase [Planctomycetaceae bacterium]